jgi:carboxyl-terminal processing protease
MENNIISKYKGLTIIVILLLSSFAGGLYAGKNNTIPNKVILTTESDMASTTISLDAFWKVWKTLDEKFVYTKKDAKPISIDEKLWGAIEGLTAAYGDPYTVFMPPEEAKTFESDISGNFEGVGMELGIKDKNLVVVAPLKNTPAYKSGVQKGDILLDIDGTTAIGLSIDTAVKMIRGKAGTPVTITFSRDGVKDPIEIEIIRDFIDIPTVSTEIKEDVFIIRLYMFNAISADKFRLSLREFAESGNRKLILDLRGNPGGYLEAAVDMASWFLPMGKTVVRESFGENTLEIGYRSKGYDVFNDTLKMVVLIDEGSASASEILAGALQEHGIAKLVGAKTFGKGSVQELLRITSDTSLKVTVAQWLTPNGTSISDGGLTPDYEVSFTADDVKGNIDPQMEKALEILR